MKKLFGIYFLLFFAAFTIRVEANFASAAPSEVTEFIVKYKKKQVLPTPALIFLKISRWVNRYIKDIGRRFVC